MADSKTIKVGILGSGLTGLVCARKLQQKGFDVELIEPKPTIGGFLSSHVAGSEEFDDGIQFFTITDPRLETETAAWIEDGLAVEWKPRLVKFSSLEQSGSVQLTATAEVNVLRHPGSEQLRRYVAIPSMHALPQSLASTTHIVSNIVLHQISKSEDGWIVETSPRVASRSDASVPDSHGQKTISRFDNIVVNLPFASMSQLLADSNLPSTVKAAMDKYIEQEYLPSWVMLVSFPGPLPLDFDAAVFETPIATQKNGSGNGTSNPAPIVGSPVHTMSWLAKNSSKPGRPPGETWVVQASTSWSQQHLTDPPSIASAFLLASFMQIIGPIVPPVKYLTAKLWPACTKSATVTAFSEAIYMTEHGIGFSIDEIGVSGSNMQRSFETAFCNGIALADQISSRWQRN